MPKVRLAHEDDVSFRMTDGAEYRARDGYIDVERPDHLAALKQVAEFKVEDARSYGMGAVAGRRCRACWFTAIVALAGTHCRRCGTAWPEEAADGQ